MPAGPAGGRVPDEAPALVVFDAYGTLLDVHGAMAAHAARLPPDWERLAVEWRQKQLEYTWITTLTGPGHHRDFWTLTRAALDHVAARHRLFDPALLDALMTAYRELPAYPDAAPTLRALRAAGIRSVILSNGEPAMLDAAVRAAGLADLLDGWVSVEELGVFKPHPAVYTLAGTRFGVPPSQSAFVSSNAWDAQGAVAAGFRVFWCNRAGSPHEYGLERSATTIAGLADLEAFLD